MKTKHWVLVAVIALGFALFWNYVDYNTEINRLSEMYDIPKSDLKVIYPYVPFKDFTSLTSN